jgi:hypothetical protein
MLMYESLRDPLNMIVSLSLQSGKQFRHTRCLQFCCGHCQKTGDEGGGDGDDEEYFNSSAGLLRDSKTLHSTHWCGNVGSLNASVFESPAFASWVL